MKRITFVSLAFLFSFTSTQPLTTTIDPNASRISVRKCNEYKDLTYKKNYVSNLPGPQSKRKDCPSIPTPTIIGGVEANLREFPHMALIGFEDGNTIHWGCGGTLISEQFVLTAAHCFYSSKHGPAKYVRLGEHDLSSDIDGTPIDVTINGSIPHPQYKIELQYNDIGLLKLDRIIELNGAIRPACLPDQSTIPVKAIATGWGEVAWRGHRSNVLRKVTLDVFTHSECSDSSYISRSLPRGIKERTQLCAGSREGIENTCQGDSGGPLQTYHATHEFTYTIFGITSFGNACGSKKASGVYTRVSAYLEWIEQTVWPDQ